MGRVYPAADARLERNVALKVVRRETGPKLDTGMRRESQAIAQLKHPNVVRVFEVGV